MKKIFTYFISKISSLIKISRLERRFNCYIHPQVELNIADENKINLGKGVKISAFSLIVIMEENPTKNLSYLEIGENTYIGEFNNIRASGGNIRIGKNCLISQHISVVAVNHRIEGQQDIMFSSWEDHRNFVIIEDNVWIGANCVILPGTIIHEGAIIAAGSVVKGDVPAFSIYGGVPAKKIRDRQKT